MSSSFSLPELCSYIAGERIPCLSPLNLSDESKDGFVSNANTGEALQQRKSASLDEAERALACAKECFETGAWMDLGTEGRAAAMERIALELEPQVALMAWCDAVTTGVSINLTSKMCGLVPLLFRMSAKYILDGNMDKKEEGDSMELYRDNNPIISMRRFRKSFFQFH